MVESLKDLDTSLKKHNSRLHIFFGDNITILKKIFKVKGLNIGAVAFNMDYTPYALARDKKIRTLCEKNKIDCISNEDYLLSKIGTLNKKDGTPYLVFTPFRNNALKRNPPKPKSLTPTMAKGLVKTDKFKKIESPMFSKYKDNPNILVRGGRKSGLKLLAKVKKQKNYDKTRNTLSISTTELSAHIKFGTISIREVYYKIMSLLKGKSEATLISQLYWREFYFYIVYYFPRVLSKSENYNPKYNGIKWLSPKTTLQKWKDGRTGYPIVDACMRQLNQVGYMHNRGRLISSNFMNRLLGLDWRHGEKYFANKLTDYDPSINNSNWQWIASVGVDPKPYFQRLFNPWLQGKKFDPKATYIKKWLPNLKDIPAKELHEWEKYYHNYDIKKMGYYKPIVDYSKARKRSIQMYRKVLY